MLVDSVGADMVGGDGAGMLMYAIEMMLRLANDVEMWYKRLSPDVRSRSCSRHVAGLDVIVKDNYRPTMTSPIIDPPERPSSIQIDHHRHHHLHHHSIIPHTFSISQIRFLTTTAFSP